MPQDYPSQMRLLTLMAVVSFLTFSCVSARHKESSAFSKQRSLASSYPQIALDPNEAIAADTLAQEIKPFIRKLKSSIYTYTYVSRSSLSVPEQGELNAS